VRREKIAMFCNVHEADVISDSNMIMFMLVIFTIWTQGLCEKVLKKLTPKKGHDDLECVGRNLLRNKDSKKIQLQ